MSGSHLPLHEQLVYTDGYCEAFARAMIDVYGDALRVVELVVSDHRATPPAWITLRMRRSPRMSSASIATAGPSTPRGDARLPG